MQSRMPTSAVWEFVRGVEAVGATADGERFQCRLVGLLTQTLRARAREERPAVIECEMKLARAFLDLIHVVQIRFEVGDWTMVPVVESLVQEQKLQFEPIALREPDNQVTRGIWALHEGKPLIALTATSTAEVLHVRFASGFQPAIVLRDDNESDV